MGKHLIDLSKCKNYCFWDKEAQAIAVFCQGKDKLFNGFFFCDAEAIPLLVQSKYSIDSSGYARCTLNHKQHLLHRQLIDGQLIDHINQSKLDNRIKNLRSTSKKINAINSKKISTNSSGHRGVHKSKLKYKNGDYKWRAAIFNNGINIHIGQFRTKDEALKARIEAELEYWGEKCPTHKEYC